MLVAVLVHPFGSRFAIDHIVELMIIQAQHSFIFF